MESRRAETLEALSAYLEHQRTLLARTQADIERLKKLKADAVASPEQFVGQPFKLDEKLPELQDYHPSQSFPTNIAWEAFSSSDPTPLRTLAIRSRIDYTQQSVPSNVQQSPLSVLQKFVKDARKVILDPVLENLSTPTDTITFSNPTVISNLHINPAPSSDPNHVPTLTLSSPHIIEHEHEHKQHESIATIRKRGRQYTKVQEPKKCKIKIDVVSACELGEEAFVRDNIEDESAKVDVNMEMPSSCRSVPPDDSCADPMDVDNVRALAAEDALQHETKLPNSRGTHNAVLSLRDHIHRESRTRKPSLKLKLQTLTPPKEAENKPAPSPMSSQGLGKLPRDITELNDKVCKPRSEPLSVSEVNAETDKNRSDTYKLAWSISEQHLLERLLEDIPDGERNRWAKISQAMGGRRTPRQVASRVQKYFEKLKRFGVGVDTKNKAKS